VALLFTLKSILRQKKSYGNSNIFNMQKKYSSNKISLKETKNPSRYHDFITNLKVSTQAKISSFKNPPMKIGLLLPRGQNPLSY
jgi:hypothetical protein